MRFPGILTSSILGIGRVAGETAPIMFTRYACAMKCRGRSSIGPISFSKA
jgi:ABC-type phosphate transport system, permease component